MATHALPSSHILADDDAPARAPSRRVSARGLLCRLYIAILISQTRRAHRDIERVLGPGALQRAMRGEYSTRR